jgi:SAM-dependent MidA family methyltransferase
VTATDLVLERIARRGPLPLAEVLDVALYHPDHGFYEAGGAAGRREGDFLTSPEVGPLFGAVVARAIDGWWDALGRPDPYVVVEAGAGPGTLARAILAVARQAHTVGGMACAEALRYVLVERSSAQRRRHAEHLPIEHPSLVLPPMDTETERPIPEAPKGPLCTSLAELPRVPGRAVVLANELLDNLPIDLAERRDDGWYEIRVGADGGTLFEVAVPLDETRTALLARLAPDAQPGARVPLQAAADTWLQDARSTAGKGGRVVVVDYATTTADMASRPQDEWLRTYREHSRGKGHLDDLGLQDVTCDVAVDQLSVVCQPSSNTAQSDWLQVWGIEALVEEGRQIWSAKAHAPDLAAVAARSRITEADALLEPTALGAFRVLEWQ